MSGYVRPSVESVEFRDDDGNIIDCGNRWNARDALDVVAAVSPDGNWLSWLLKASRLATDSQVAPA